jgi:uncharacterized protein with PQ loop repeat
MNTDTIFDIFGYIGATFLSIMMIPQVYLTVKTNRTEDLSIKFIIFNLCAIAFLLPYSIYFKIYPVLIANFSVFICNFILLIYCIKNYRANN